jgi:hypothetical protein
MWSRGIIAGVLAVATLAAQASAVSEAPRQSYSDVFTTKAPGASTGRTYTIDWFNPEDPEGKPYAFSHLRVELAEGARFDTSAIAQCKASDAEIMAAGEAACPAESKVANDTTLIDSGYPDPGRYYNIDFAFFNNENELILLSTVRESGTRVVLRGVVGTNTIDVDVPTPLPGTPPDGGAAKHQVGEWVPRSTMRDGVPANYLTTPPTCPAGGYWVNRVTYTYRDGVKQTAESRSPCEPGRRGGRGDTRKPKVRAEGLPRTCASRGFRVLLRIFDASRLRAVRARLDGRSIAAASRKRLSVHVPAGRIRPGRHTLAVTATDAAGNRGEGQFRFRVCRT